MGGVFGFVNVKLSFYTIVHKYGAVRMCDAPQFLTFARHKALSFVTLYVIMPV